MPSIGSETPPFLSPQKERNQDLNLSSLSFVQNTYFYGREGALLYPYGTPDASTLLPEQLCTNIQFNVFFNW